MEREKLNAEIDRVISYLNSVNPDTEEYKVAVENLKVLYEMGYNEKTFLIRPETIFTEALKLLSLVLILRREEFYVITSRAFSWIRPK